jgi:hypothetical protein
VNKIEEELNSFKENIQEIEKNPLKCLTLSASATHKKNKLQNFGFTNSSNEIVDQSFLDAVQMVMESSE